MVKSEFNDPIKEWCIRVQTKLTENTWKAIYYAVFIALAYIRKSGGAFHHHHHTLFASPIPTDTPNCIPHQKKFSRDAFYQLKTSIFSFFSSLSIHMGLGSIFFAFFIYVKWKINSTLPSSPSNRTKRIFIVKYFHQEIFPFVFLFNFSFHSYSPPIYSCRMTLSSGFAYKNSMHLCVFAFSSTLLLVVDK